MAGHKGMARLAKARAPDTRCATVYTLLAFLSFCSDSYRLPVGVKYAVDLVVFAWAAADFLVRPRLARAAFCGRFLVLFFVPYLVFWLWSACVWIAQLQQAAYILRGTKNTVYMLANFLFVCSAVYLLGRDAVFCTFAAMGLAHTLVLVQVLASYGAGEILRELVRLVATFASDTGPALSALELHGLAFGWGVFVLYFLIDRSERVARRRAGLAVSGLFFLLSFKRILVPAVLGGLAVWTVARKAGPERLRRLSAAMAAIIGGAGYGYLLAIRNGVFFTLADRLGIDLKFRDVLYRYYEDFYHLSPDFPGHGIRFIYAYAAEHPEAYEAVHNVYLEVLIEVGFWCWWFWIFYELYFRVRRVLAWGFVRGAAAMLAVNALVFCTYFTDNTLFYYCINVTSRMVVLSFCLAQAPAEAGFAPCRKEGPPP